MKEITLPTTDFAENAVVNVSRVFAVLWCIAQNIYRKGEQRTMKMIENEMNVTVPLEIIKASEIEPKEVKWLWYPYIPFGKVTLLQGGRSRRWEKQVNVINRRPALKWRTAFYGLRRKIRSRRVQEIDR